MLNISNDEHHIIIFGCKKRRENAQPFERNGSSNPDWIQISKNDEPTKSFTIDFKSIYLWIKYASTFKHMITQIIYVFTAYLWTFFLVAAIWTQKHTRTIDQQFFFYCFHRHRLLVLYFFYFSRAIAQIFLMHSVWP